MARAEARLLLLLLRLVLLHLLLLLLLLLQLPKQLLRGLHNRLLLAGLTGFWLIRLSFFFRCLLHLGLLRHLGGRVVAGLLRIHVRNRRQLLARCLRRSWCRNRLGTAGPGG